LQLAVKFEIVADSDNQDHQTYLHYCIPYITTK